VGLRGATLFLIVGSAYTVLHKAAQGLLPALSGSPVAGAVMSVLWLVATFALILFAYEFLREVRPRDNRLRYSLISVIVFTAGVLLSKLPIWPVSQPDVGHRLLFGGASTLNAFAILVFVVSLSRLVAPGSPLRAPLRVLVWALGITVALALAAAGYFLVYLLTGLALEPLPVLQPAAILSFVITYGATLWFLVRFWLVGEYRNLVPM
jgi:hypothetical protein